jgi:hypothetical protein
LSPLSVSFEVRAANDAHIGLRRYTVGGLVLLC